MDTLQEENALALPVEAITQEELQRELQKWRQESTDILDNHVLNFDAFAPQEPAEARQSALISSFLEVQFDHTPDLETGSNYETYRDAYAEQMFEGRGVGNDNAFFSEIQREATTRKDSRDLQTELAAAAARESLTVLTGGDAANTPTTFNEFLAQSEARPGYDPKETARYRAIWNKSRAALQQSAAPFAEELRSVYSAMKLDADRLDSDKSPFYVGDAARKAYATIPAEQRNDFLAHLSLIAKALPEPERKAFFQNLSASANRENAAWGRSLVEGPRSIFLQGISQAAGVTGPMASSDAEEAAAQAAMFGERNFRADIATIAAEDYDPIAYLTQEGSWARDFEAAAYAIPGALTTTATAAVPYIGFAAVAGGMQDQAYTQQRRELIAAFKEQGLSAAEADQKATAIAGPLSILIAAPQAALEKVQAMIPLGQLPGATAVANRFKNPLARFGARWTAASAAETAVELSQDFTPVLIRNFAEAIDSDIPGSSLATHFEDYEHTTLRTFLTVLPLGIAASVQGISQDMKAKTLADATPLERMAAGMSQEDSDALDAAKLKGPASLIETAAKVSFDPSTPKAAAAMRQLETELLAKERAFETAQASGIVPRIVEENGTWTLHNDATGEVIGTAPDRNTAVAMATEHLGQSDIEADDQLADVYREYLDTTLAAIEGESTEGLTQDFDPSRTVTTTQAAAESEANAERIAWQASTARETLETGSAPLARLVLGQNVSQLREGVRTSVNQLNSGASALTVVHEKTHHDFRAALDTGAITQPEALAFVRAAQTVLQQRNTPQAFDYLPDNDADVTLEHLDEAIAEIVEAEILRTRKGGGVKGLAPGIVTRNLTAIGKLAAGPSGKFSAFLRAIKDHFRLVFSRAATLNRALKSGELNQAEYDTFLTKLIGHDVQADFDQMARDAESAILEGAEMTNETLDDSQPFSLGPQQVSSPLSPAQDAEYLAAVQAGDMKTALEIAKTVEPAIADLMPQVGSFSRALGLNGPGKGWDAAQNMSRNAAKAIEDGKVMQPDLPEIIGQIIGLETVPDAAIQAGLQAAAYSFPEYHHVGKKKEEVSFYDVARIEESPRFWLGLAGELTDGRDAAFNQSVIAWEAMKAPEPPAPITTTPQTKSRTTEVGERLEKLDFLISRQESKRAGQIERKGAPTPEVLAKIEAYQAEQAELIAEQKKDPARAAEAAGTPNPSTQFSLGPSALADTLKADALTRVRDPERRAQIMRRVADKMEKLRLTTERLELVSKNKRLRTSLTREARIREALRREELENEVYARHFEILDNDDLTKLKEQPIHGFLSTTKADGKVDPLHGRLMSLSAAIKAHPDLFQQHRPAEYNGSETVTRSLFGGTLTPDQAAQEAFEEGLIAEPTPDALWTALGKEAQSVASMKEALDRAKSDMREARLQAKEETNIWLAQKKVDVDRNTQITRRDEVLHALAQLDAILSTMPPEIRGRVGGYLNLARLTTDEARLKELQKRLNLADKYLEAWFKDTYTKEFEILLKRVSPQQLEPGEKPRGTVSPEIHELFKTVQFWMGESMVLAEAEADKLDKLAAADPDDVGLTTDQQQIHALTANMIRLAGDWMRADSARREAALTEGLRIAQGAIAEARIEASRKRETRQAHRRQAEHDAGGDKSPLTRDQRNHKRATVRERLRSAKYALYSFPQTLSAILGEASPLTQHFTAWEAACATAKHNALQNKAHLVEDLFESLAGNKYKGTHLRHKLATEIFTISVPGNTSREMTQMEMIGATLMWRQEDGKRHMLGHLDDAGAPIGDWHYSQDFIDAIEAQLSDDAKAVRLHLAEQYAAEYDRLNAVYRQVYNVNLPRHKYYSPLTVSSVHASTKQIMDPESGLGDIGISMTPGALRTRSTSAVAEPKFKDALQTFLAHSQQMEHWMAYAPMVTEAMATFQARDVRNAVEAAGGEQATNALARWIDYLATGGNYDAANSLAINRELSGAVNRLSAAALIGRVSVLAIQATQLGAAKMHMSTGAYLKALAKLAAGRLDFKKALKSEFIRRRLDQMPPAVRQAMEGLTSTKPNKVKHYAQILGQTISGADALFTSATYAILYEYHYKHAPVSLTSTVDRAAYARETAERLTEEVAQPTRPGQRSLAENTATTFSARLIWPFASEARQKISLALFAIAEKAPTPALRRQRIRRAIVVTWLFGGVGAALIRAAMRDLKDDRDDELFDERNWDPAALALASIFGPANGIPVIGEQISNFAATAVGERTFSGDLTDSLGNIGQTVSRADDYFTGKADIDRALKDFENIANGSAFFSETGGGVAAFSHLIRDLYRIGENIEGPD